MIRIETARAYFERVFPDSAPNAVAPEANSADSAPSTMSACCECWLPIHATKTRLAPSEPTMAPSVLAAYTPPTSRAGSCPDDATAASATGKLAPLRMAAGNIAQTQRTRPTPILKHRLPEASRSTIHHLRASQR